MQPNDAHDCRACDRPNSADVGMVACDGCRAWYHYSCAKVSPGVEKRSWRCSTCQSEIPSEASGTKKKGSKKSASVTVPGAVPSEIPNLCNASQKKKPEKTKNLTVPGAVPSEISKSSIVTPKRNPDILLTVKPTHGEMKSSKSSTSTARARAQLALQRLEGERLLEEQKLMEERERLKEERIRLEKEKQLKEQEHAIKAKELALQEKYLQEKFKLEEQLADDENSSKSSVPSGIEKTKAWLKSQQDGETVSQYSVWQLLGNDAARSQQGQ